MPKPLTSQLPKPLPQKGTVKPGTPAKPLPADLTKKPAGKGGGGHF
ncbi:MAG: hypothetical protein IIY44_04715 [Erysipelotrichales bacterium]|nr:hypothetical protein [Erysipelotrichales bacterium]